MMSRRTAPLLRLAVTGVLACALVCGAATTAQAGAPAAPATPAPAAVLAGLKIGSVGPAVKQLQQALIAAGQSVYGGADGVFGPATVTAVKAYQRAHGLAATGAVDDATAAALSGGATAPAATSGYTGLKRGSVGPAVADVQRKLIAVGVGVAGGVDGIFGAATERSLKTFQQVKGLAATGTVDAATAVALGLVAPAASNGSTSSGSPYVGLKLGSTGPAVTQLQEAILKTGLVIRDGGANGVFGPSTRTAVVLVQRVNRFTETGEVDERTARALGLVGGGPAAGNGAANAAAEARYIGLKTGSFGDAVRELQRAIMRTGLTVFGGADGVFGNGTRNALILAQRTNGIAESGVVDRATARVLGLLGTPAATTTGYPSFGERGARVKALQEALIRAGIPVFGGADGAFGSGTASAVMAFQRAQGIPATGKVDKTTATALGLEAATAPPPVPAGSVTLKVFPVQGLCWFGDTWHAPRGGGRLHEGVDVIAAAGKELYAVTDGLITGVYFDHPGSLSGNAVRLTTADGTYFYYAHMSAHAEGLAAGQRVKAGHLLGYVGSTGNAATNHLHFEVHPRGGAATNPYPLAKAIDACRTTAPRPRV